MKRSKMFYTVATTKAVLNTVVKVVFFGIAASLVLIMWHVIKGNELHPFAHYMEDSLHLSVIMEALKAFIADTWETAVEDTEELLIDAEEGSIIAASKKAVSQAIQGITK